MDDFTADICEEEDTPREYVSLFEDPYGIWCFLLALFCIVVVPFLIGQWLTM